MICALNAQSDAEDLPKDNSDQPELFWVSSALYLGVESLSRRLDRKICRMQVCHVSVFGLVGGNFITMQSLLQVNRVLIYLVP